MQNYKRRCQIRYSLQDKIERKDLLLSLKSEIFPYSRPDRDQSLRVQRIGYLISGQRIGLMKRRNSKIQEFCELQIGLSPDYMCLDGN